MVSLGFFLFLALSCVYVFSTARHALPLILMVGFTQDMVRKLTPGEPVIFIVTVGVLFAAALLGIWARKGVLGSLEPFLAWSNGLREPLLVFLLILLLQLAYSIAQYNNVVVGLIGLTSYLAPFLALVVGYALAGSIDNIRKFLKVYVIGGLVVAASVVISFVGVEHTILNEVGVGIIIYDQGTALKSHAGILRSGEIAAWHVATCACSIVALALTSRRVKGLILPLTITAILILVITLTGRRKMVMLCVLFLGSYAAAMMYYRNTMQAQYFFGFIGLVLMLWVGFEVVNLEDYSRSLRDYIARGSTVFSDATGRFVELGVNPIQWAYNRVGILGGGLGIASQGSYLFTGNNIAGGSGEGGLGKIMVELGLPGLLCVVWLGITFIRHINQILKLSLRREIDPRLFPLMLSLTVLLASNALTFSVATQVYGDIFILVWLGLAAGFVFALPKLAVASLSEQPKMRLGSLQATVSTS